MAYADEAEQERGSRAPKKGKGSAVLIRVTQETRAALEAEAERTGRSLSQVAERWLDDAISGLATYTERLGGLSVLPTLEQLTAFAWRITREIGDPATDPVAREALLHGWHQILENVLPIALGSAAEQSVFRARVELHSRAADFMGALGELAADPAGHPALKAMLERPSLTSAQEELALIAAGKLSVAASVGTLSPAAMLLAAMDNLDPVPAPVVAALVQRLNSLPSGSVLDEPARQLRDALDAYRQADEAVERDRGKARELGHRIAEAFLRERVQAFAEALRSIGTPER